MEKNISESIVIDGIQFHKGEKWREVDNRFTRIVQVIAWDLRFKKIGIFCEGRLTWAKASRFNGKNRGYKRIQ